MVEAFDRGDSGRERVLDGPQPTLESGIADSRRRIVGRGVQQVEALVGIQELHERRGETLGFTAFQVF